ncbi:hypothetical protein BDY17DRAFT_42617 [Neohortaea acidophila]|uniref:Uncharacterized protein n=1 Tax=Neohortaea acidophila TaxID=245834 RepID=A0A6A6PJE1_9PEZI|nr:uncharacterized protein BDY17DRAFT_42617 [Neohortaea acidophila]KAF2479643.1 hypothetical protein BDY17DRAFT_42617 [Neohortaea acidophila]
MNERDRIYNTTLTSIRALMGLLRKTHNNTQLDNTRPTMSTLQELVVAALTCPGFSEAQKYIVVANLHQSGNGSVANSRGMNFRFGGTHKFASDWPFEGLAMQPGVDETVVEYIAALIHAATVHAPAPTLAELHAYRAAAMQQSLFGMLDIDYTGAKTMADVGRIELRTIKSLLSRVLPRAGDDEAQAEVHSTSSSSAYGSPDYGRGSRYR